AFLGLQCGLSIGLARRALAEAKARLGDGRSVLEGEWQALNDELKGLERALRDGLKHGHFAAGPVPLFKIRIGLAQVAAEAVQLELQASGGKAYLQAHGSGFARRVGESAFVAVVTPSLVELQSELRKHGELAACPSCARATSAWATPSGACWKASSWSCAPVNWSAFLAPAGWASPVCCVC